MYTISYRGSNRAFSWLEALIIISFVSLIVNFDISYIAATRPVMLMSSTYLYEYITKF